jgi:GDP-4-dehydro-6-deoxy-D-mannose reductase
MSRVLVTGATGFVGRHLVRLLQDRGDRIFGTCFPDQPDIQAGDFVHLDLRSEADLAEFVRKSQPERIVHLAAVSNVRQSWDKRTETLQTNLLGTSNLFEAARRYAPGCRILFLSSSDVYGELSGQEKYFKEEDPCQVVSPYAFSKVAGELLSRFYFQVEKLDIVLARPFPHAGPGQASNFVFSDWARQVALIDRGQRPPLMEVGNLAIRRDYSDVRDTVKAYALLLDKGRPGETYNVCSGKAVSLREVLDTLVKLLARPVEVRQDPSRLRKTDIPFLAGDGSKLRRETGWAPLIPFSQTLRDIVDYWRGMTP